MHNDFSFSPQEHIIRAKKKDSDQYIEGYYVQLGDTPCIFTGQIKTNSLSFFSTTSPEFYEINPYTVQRAVGFCDESLKLIFDSDILYDSLNNEVLHVSWNKLLLTFEFIPLELDETEEFPLKGRYDKKKTVSSFDKVYPSDYFKTTKIVGNISEMTSYEIRQLLLDITAQKQATSTMR